MSCNKTFRQALCIGLQQFGLGTIKDMVWGVDAQDTPSVQQLSQHLADVTAEKQRLADALSESQAQQASLRHDLARAESTKSTWCSFQTGLEPVLEALLREASSLRERTIKHDLVLRLLDLLDQCRMLNLQSIRLPVCATLWTSWRYRHDGICQNCNAPQPCQC